MESTVPSHAVVGFVRLEPRRRPSLDPESRGEGGKDGAKVEGGGGVTPEVKEEWEDRLLLSARRLPSPVGP